MGPNTGCSHSYKRWRCLAFVCLILVLLVYFCYWQLSFCLVPHSASEVSPGHVQTKMLVDPSATDINVPDEQVFLTGNKLDADIDNIMLDLNKERNVSYKSTESILVTKGISADNFHYAAVSDVPLKKNMVVSCADLFRGDVSALKTAMSYQHNNKYIPIQDIRYTEFTSNCDTFRHDRQYLSHPVNAEEENYPLAFSILVFKEIEQFERLLRAIYRPQNYYCVHVDLKASVDVKVAVSKITRCFKNVFIASKSIDIVWGTYSVLKPEIVCMENLWKYKKWKYFINLTGQEFPLKTNLEIVKILKVLNGANSMEGTVQRRNKERTAFKGPPPIPVTLAKGSVHIAASRAFIHYVLHDQRALKFRQWVKDTGIPDETFFASLNHSPQLEVPGAYKGLPETDEVRYPFIARFKNWGVTPFSWPCYGERVRMICIFGVEDLHLLGKRPELFANKFYIDYQPLVLNCMEEMIYNRTRLEIQGSSHFDTAYYERLDLVKNHI